MRAQHKIFIGIACLIFILFSLFGCKLATLFQTKSQYKTVILDIYEEKYSIKIPDFMPNFTEFETCFRQFYFTDVINFFIPEGGIDKDGFEDHYRFIISGDRDDEPGILALMLFTVNKQRQWIYQDKIPVEISFREMKNFINSWKIAKQEKLNKKAEEEDKTESI